MTRDEMKAKLAAVIRACREDGLCEYDTAAAVLALCGPKPLIWVQVDRVLPCIVLVSGLYTVWPDGSWRKDGECHGRAKPHTLEAAQAAAQAHYEAAHWANTPMEDL